MRKFIYCLVFSIVFGFALTNASAQLRTTSFDTKTTLSIYSQVLAPTRTGSLSSQDPQMIKAQDPQMYEQDPQMLTGQDPQMLKLNPYSLVGQDPQM